MAMFPLSNQQIQDLAPQSMRSLRIERYTGDGSDTPLDTFSPSVQDAIKSVYTDLIQILELTRPTVAGGITIEQVLASLQYHTWSRHLEALRSISIDQADLTAHRRPAVGQVLHDIRGGSLQALSMQLQLIHLGIVQPSDLERIFLLARDHLKIMRNCIPDLDTPRYELDRIDRAHGVRLILEKWQNIHYQLPGGDAEIMVACTYDGTVADRCVEFAALDRVLYNMINNATRFALNRQVYLMIAPIHEPGDTNLRFVIANALAPAQYATLETQFAGNLAPLFAGGFTTGGNGVGLSVCAEIVANAYGLPSASYAVERQYLGARAQQDTFIVWFHWPIAAA